MARPSRYPRERMVAEVLPNNPSEWPATVAVADKLGVGTVPASWADSGRWAPRRPVTLTVRGGYADAGAVESM